MKYQLIIISLFFLIFGVCQKSAIAQKVSVSGLINEKTVKLGKIASGKIILTIPEELHINSNKPTDEFLVPTTVRFSSLNVTIGKIIYPKGISQKFAFSDKPLSVYEGKTIIKFTFSIPANFKKRQVTIDAVIQYQACNQEVCFPPKKEKIVLSTKIK